MEQKKGANQQDSNNSKVAGKKEHKKEFVCDVCKKIFPTAYKINRHVKIHQDPIKEFKCKICNMAFASEEYVQRHFLSVHEEKKHKCDLCTYQSSSKTNLERHKIKKHSDKS